MAATYARVFFAFSAMVVMLCGMIVLGAEYYEYRHPCLKYSTSYVFVPGSREVVHGRFGGRVELVLPHYELESVCEERK